MQHYILEERSIKKGERIFLMESPKENSSWKVHYYLVFVNSEAYASEPIDALVDAKILIHDYTPSTKKDFSKERAEKLGFNELIALVEE